MADEQLMSQDEIEKLLSQKPGGQAGPPAASPAAPPDASDEAAPAASVPKPVAPTVAAHKPAASDDSDKLLAQDDIEKLLNAAGKTQPAPVVQAAPPKEAPPPSSVGEGSMPERDIEFLLHQAERALESINSPPGNDIPHGVAAFRFEDFSGSPPSTEVATLDLIRDVELDMKIELGRTHMYLEDVLRLRKGSVVPLDKLAGDPVDIYVNGRLIARGEVLVMNDNFCVRVAELIAGVQVA